MDVVTAVLQAQVNQILIFAGIIIVFFTVFNIDLSKKAIGIRPTDKSTTPIVIIAVLFGAGFIIGGLFYPKSHSDSPGPSTLEPGITISSQTPVPQVEAPSQTPEAQSVSIIPTDTPAVSTNTPEPTAAKQSKTLADGCIADQTWKPASIDETVTGAVSSSNGCLNLEGLHIIADQKGTLHFVTKAGKTKLASGMYTPIHDNSVIEFSITVTQLFILYKGDLPATLTFAIAPPGKAMSELGTGRFKFLADNTSGKISYLAAGADQGAGSILSGLHPALKKPYAIKLELSGLSMQVYINNTFTKEVTIPSGSKVLYIGYSLQPASGIDLEISELKIDGQTP